jgi:4'-phosphopantetheinyl transferase
MIDDGVVHVWRAPLDADDTSELHRALSVAERGRAAAFLRERDSVRFSTGRGVLRHVLSRYTGSRPGELRLAVDAHGKPRVDGGLQFSFSRSAGIAVVAVSAGRDVGVDVERIRGDFACEPIARRFFSRTESERLAGAGAPERVREFFRCWTRKEAVVKAVGFGLSLPLETFTVPAGDGIVTPEPGWPCSRPYVLRGFHVRSGYAAAVALEGEGARVELRDFVPVSAGAQVGFSPAAQGQ